MNKIFKSAITAGIAVTTYFLPVASAHGEIYSRSKELVVVEPRNLPEQAQIPGNSLLLHSDNAGNTYLYVEQQQGARLSVFNVTDPGHIKLTVSCQMPNEGAFDFVRPLGESAELIYFRDGHKVGVLDLRKAKKPQLRTVATSADLAAAEQLGESGLLATNASYAYTPAVAREFQVIDISSANPTPLATVKDVKHRVTNDETGTTFLLGSDGLTVVRRLDVEAEHEVEQRQTQGN